MIKIKNISLNIMDLELEIGDSGYIDDNTDKLEQMLDYKEKR
jgi:hypothetical protein